MSPITTHVLDTMTGKPAQNLSISLFKQTESNSYTLLATGNTDSDGRIKNLLRPGELTPGQYKMHFDTAQYLQTAGIDGFYPEVVICFQIQNTDEHYHIPLLLSPFGYSTYRGS